MKRMTLFNDGTNLISFLGEMIASTYGLHHLQVEMLEKAGDEPTYDEALKVAREYFIFNDDSLERAEEIGGQDTVPHMTSGQRQQFQIDQQARLRRARTFGTRLYEDGNDPLRYWFRLQPHIVPTLDYKLTIKM